MDVIALGFAANLDQQCGDPAGHLLHWLQGLGPCSLRYIFCVRGSRWAFQIIG
jgi:hypothetical protein